MIHTQGREDIVFTLSPAGGGIFNFILLWINLPSRERKLDFHPLLNHAEHAFASPPRGEGYSFFHLP
jgi:hypothetical protein